MLDCMLRACGESCGGLGVPQKAVQMVIIRPAKHVRSLTELTEEGRARAERVLGQDATRWASVASGDSSALLMRAEDVPPEALHSLGLSVMTSVSRRYTSDSRRHPIVKPSSTLSSMPPKMHR